MSKIQDYLSKILSARYGKDVRQSIHDAIQQCYYDGKAGSIDLEGRNIAAEAIATEKEERQQEIAFERARIDNLSSLKEGSTTGDAELQDIRVGVNGKTYDNAGSSVRGQISDLKGDFLKIQDAEWYNGYFESWGEYKSPDSTYQEKYCYVPAVKGNTILFEYGYNNQHDSALCEIFECNDRKQQICGDTRVPPGDGKNYKFEYTASNSETAYILIQFRSFGDILYKNVYITDYASFDYAKIIENELLQDLGGLSFSINSDDGGLDIVIKEE